MTQFHALVVHRLFPDGQDIQHHTKHRTMKAAARSLSKGITAARKPGPGWVTYCSVVAPDGRVMSLRMAQGKMDYTEPHEVLSRAMREAAAA